jgi:hypothetical protein
VARTGGLLCAPHLRTVWARTRLHLPCNRQAEDSRKDSASGSFQGSSAPTRPLGGPSVPVHDARPPTRGLMSGVPVPPPCTYDHSPSPSFQPSSHSNLSYSPAHNLSSTTGLPSRRTRVSRRGASKYWVLSDFSDFLFFTPLLDFIWAVSWWTSYYYPYLVTPRLRRRRRRLIPRLIHPIPSIAH